MSETLNFPFQDQVNHNALIRFSLQFIQVIEILILYKLAYLCSCVMARKLGLVIIWGF